MQIIGLSAKVHCMLMFKEKKGEEEKDEKEKEEELLDLRYIIDQFYSLIQVCRYNLLDMIKFKLCVYYV